VLAGGAGNDEAELIFEGLVDDPFMDFRHSYDQVLTGGITLVGIESVAVFGGSGNDRIWGG